jgi:hypothetical protein
MCFVLDSNTFHSCFDKSSRDYAEFLPLTKWLYNNPHTSIVFGGTHYRNELRKLKKYTEFLVELSRNRKISEISDELIDKEEDRIKQVVTNKDFDDPHIIAIFCVSGCKILASKDQRADSYIKMKELYPNQKPPSIYRNRTHAPLLRSKNIVPLKNLKS